MLTGYGEVTPGAVELVPKKFGVYQTFLLEPGVFVSEENGKVEITKEHVLGIYEEYNKEMDMALAQAISERQASPNKPNRLKKFLEGQPKVDDFLGADVRVDHNFDTVEALKGRVKGKLWLENSNSEMPQLWGNLKVIGEENVFKVDEGLYHKVSVTFNGKTKKLREVSFVGQGACPRARIQDENLNQAILLSGTNILDKKEIVTENGDDRLQLISLVHKGLREIDTQLIRLEQRKEVTVELRTLMAQGKILPKFYRNGLVEEVMSLESHNDRRECLRLMSKLAPQVDYAVHTNNVNAQKGMELVMNGEYGKALDKVAKQHVRAVTLAELKGKTDKEKKELLISLSEKKEGGPLMMETAPAAGMCMNEGADNDKDRYMEHVSKMLEDGKHMELAAEIKEAKEKKLAAKEPMNDKEKEDVKKEEEKLSAAKEDLLVVLGKAISDSKEEVTIMLSEALNKHEIVLGKLIEDHKELIQLAAKINSNVASATEEEPATPTEETV